MIEKLDFFVRFWELRARYEQLGIPLSESERVELLSLAKLVGSDGKLTPPAPAALGTTFGRSVPVQMTARSGFLSGDLRDVCAEQLTIAAAERLDAGERTIVHVADAVAGIEYIVPCIVIWTEDDEPCAMGLAIDGIPARSAFTAPPTGLWRSPLGLGNASRANA